VTAEAAVVLPVLVVLLVAALSAIAAVTAQMRCVDAARESARAAARGDPGAVTLGRRIGPSGAHVTVTRESESNSGSDSDTGTIRSVVVARLRPLGPWFPAVTVRATAVAAAEPGRAP
jgi:hypothetical protein